MTADLQAARQGYERAIAAHAEATRAAVAAYDARVEARQALAAARMALDLARLFPGDGPPLKIGDVVAAREGFAEGRVVAVRFGTRAHGAPRRADDLVATVETVDGIVYAVKARATAPARAYS
jgi:hypothetical protein